MNLQFTVKTLDKNDPLEILIQKTESYFNPTYSLITKVLEEYVEAGNLNNRYDLNKLKKIAETLGISHTGIKLEVLRKKIADFINEK